MSEFEYKEDNKEGMASPERSSMNSYVWGGYAEMPSPTPEPKKKKGIGWFKIILLSCCAGLCFGLVAGGTIFLMAKVRSEAGKPAEIYTSMDEDAIVSEQASKPTEKIESTSGTENIKLADTGQVMVTTEDYSEIVEAVMPAMVSILNTTVEEYNYWGQTYEQEEQYSGSGIIIAENGSELLIATNHHVVSGADKLEVNFIDGSIAEAQIKGTDADMDLAVIAIPLDKLDEETKQAIVIAQMGDSEALKLGESVIAIGNALGYGQSVTTGCVSALNREITMQDGSVGVFIQTDAAINPGNSGGALLNNKGEVIGINSSKIGGSYVEGMGYAIPISAAEPIIGELMNRETRYKVDEIGYMGTALMTITDEQAYMYDFPQGIFVREVEEGSPAEAAGMLKGDIIVNFAGEKVRNYEDLLGIMQYYGPGSEVTIKLMRATAGKYEEVEVRIVLGVNPNKE